MARVNAVLRRIEPDELAETQSKEQHQVAAGGIILNKANRTLTVDGAVVDLSTSEYEIIKVLMERPNTVLSRDQLMNLAKGKDFLAFDRSIDVHISKLRAKVEIDPRSPKRIKTIWGTGYMFVDTP